MREQRVQALSCLSVGQMAIRFKYCVIATGSSYAFPSKLSVVDRNDLPPLYKDALAIIKAANNIVLGTLRHCRLAFVLTRCCLASRSWWWAGCCRSRW